MGDDDGDSSRHGLAHVRSCAPSAADQTVSPLSCVSRQFSCAHETQTSFEVHEQPFAARGALALSCMLHLGRSSRRDKTAITTMSMSCDLGAGAWGMHSRPRE